MDIPKPQKGVITVYSKSGCSGCIKVKKLLDSKRAKFVIIDCDDYIIRDKPLLLDFIQKLIGHECKTFPMVFDNQTFIGGYTETVDYLDTLLDFDHNVEF